MADDLDCHLGVVGPSGEAALQREFEPALARLVDEIIDMFHGGNSSLVLYIRDPLCRSRLILFELQLCN